MKDLIGLTLVDIAKGLKTTGFIFEKEDGTLTGFQVPTEGIEEKDYKIVLVIIGVYSDKDAFRDGEKTREEIFQSDIEEIKNFLREGDEIIVTTEDHILDHPRIRVRGGE